MKKIMFNDRYGLTQSVLNATKTMTRRICKEQYWSFSDIVAAKNGIFHYYMYTYPHAKSSYHTPREAFAALIDKVSGKGTWDSNPWVFAYTFELVK